MTERRPQLELFSDKAAVISATEVAAGFDAARLTQARQLAGLTKAAVAEQIGVSGAAVSQWESCTSLPRPDHLRRLAEVLDVPVEFFAIGRPFAQLDGSSAHFRSLRSTKTAQRAKAVAFAQQVWELTYALEKHVQLPPVDLPGFLPDDADNQLTGTPAEAARALRSHWGLGHGPIPHLVRTLETHGIVTTMVRFAGADTPTINAFSTSRLPRPLVVLTPDRGDDVYWHRFTAAHELGHLVLHRDAAPGDPEQEREADAFAAEFLTPAAEIGDQLPRRVDFKALGQISHEWGVSCKSLIYRSRELGAISDASARRAYQRLHQLYEVGFIPESPVDHYPGEVPSLLRKAFELAETHGTLTMAGLAHELRWSIPRLRLLLGSPEQRPVLRLVTNHSDADSDTATA
ncbi:helix-turn-helix domain-containing protein [Nocardia nova]|uniref:helix-turn-helix domain-containing protein n=1 Tax=Nocardia nova TaxID=37330 RepID=UPI00189416DA|nr:XRE family transcriptional regulator [Nocardia nova]MBF6278094.1 ImmA/IrrE family metallo-endopeptidase [Nocardia nova]